jgi:hypothetical protein
MKKLSHMLDVLCAILAAFAVSAILIAFTQKFFQEKEQDGRVQDIIIRGKLYNCEEAK